MRSIQDIVRQSQVAVEPSANEPLPSALNLFLDWNAYFERFKELHGEPLRYGRRLLFPDGWTYNGFDQAGPEWPPPSDALTLCRLQRDYWKLRLNIVRTEYNVLFDLITNLRAMQRQKSVVLQTTTVVRDDNNVSRLVTQSVNLDDLEQGRLAWLKQDMVDCQTQLSQHQSRFVYLDRQRHEHRS